MRNCILHISQRSTVFGLNELSADLSSPDGSINEVINPFPATSITLSEGNYYVNLDILFDQYSNVACVTFNNDSFAGIFYAQYNGNFVDDLNGAIFYDYVSIANYFGINTYVSPPSLNGDYSSYLDGALVLMYGSNREYSIVRSYLGFSSVTSLTPLYDLIDSSFKIHTVPHEAISLKV